MLRLFARSKKGKTSGVRRSGSLGKRTKGIFAKLRKSVSGKGLGKKILIGVGVAGVVYLAAKARKPLMALVLKPAPVGANEEVSADKYRLIAKRRTGMAYVEAKGTLGGKLTFASPSAGLFTRNVVQEGSALWAEVKAS